MHNAIGFIFYIFNKRLYVAGGIQATPSPMFIIIIMNYDVAMSGQNII